LVVDDAEAAPADVGDQPVVAQLTECAHDDLPDRAQLFGNRLLRLAEDERAASAGLVTSE
jgi:hypothetical protein